MAIVEMSFRDLRKTLRPHQYKSGDAIYPVNWDEVLPEDCILDFNIECEDGDYYGVVYDTVTGTLVSRTRWYPREDAAEHAAEMAIEIYQTEYNFGQRILKGP